MYAISVLVPEEQSRATPLLLLILRKDYDVIGLHENLKRDVSDMHISVTNNEGICTLWGIPLLIVTV